MRQQVSFCLWSAYATVSLSQVRCSTSLMWRGWLEADQLSEVSSDQMLFNLACGDPGQSICISALMWPRLKEWSFWANERQGRLQQ